MGVRVCLLLALLARSVASVAATKEVESNGLVMTVSISDQWTVGSHQAIAIAFWNKAQNRMLLPLVTGMYNRPSFLLRYSSETVPMERHTNVYHYSEGFRLRRSDLVELHPGQRTVVACTVTPKVASECSLTVSFINAQDTVTDVIRWERARMGDKVTGASPVVGSRHEPDLWRGHLRADFALAVNRPRDRLMDTLKVFLEGSLMDRARALESFRPSQNEADCKTLVEVARRLEHDDPLRFSCWALACPALAKGIGAEMIPAAIEEAGDTANSKQLRLLLLELLAALAEKPYVECDEDCNFIHVELPEELRAQMKQVVDAAKADPEMRQGRQ